MSTATQHRSLPKRNRKILPLKRGGEQKKICIKPNGIMERDGHDLAKYAANFGYPCWSHWTIAFWKVRKTTDGEIGGGAQIHSTRETSLNHYESLSSTLDTSEKSWNILPILTWYTPPKEKTLAVPVDLSPIPTDQRLVWKTGPCRWWKWRGDEIEHLPAQRCKVTQGVWWMFFIFHLRGVFLEWLEPENKGLFS